MKISSNLQNNLAIFLSTKAIKQSSRSRTKTEHPKSNIKPKFKSLSPFKEKIIGQRSKLLRTELKLHKVEVYPSPDYKVLFLPENKPQYSDSLKPDKKLKIIEKLVKTPSSLDKKQGKLTKIILELVIDKVKNKEISNFEQFSEFFNRVLKDRQQKGKFEGLIKGEFDENELLNEIAKNLSEKTIKKNIDENKEISSPVMLNIKTQEKNLDLKSEEISVQDKNSAEENERKVLYLDEKESEFQENFKLNEKAPQIRTEIDQNSSNIRKKKYLNNKEKKFNLLENDSDSEENKKNRPTTQGCLKNDSDSEENKKNRPATQGCLKEEKFSDLSIINNTINDIIERDENDPVSEMFYTERDKVDKFLEMKKSSKKNKVKNYYDGILLLPRLRKDSKTNKIQENLNGEIKSTQITENSLITSKKSKNLVEPQKNTEKLFDNSDRTLKPSKSVENPLHLSKTPLESLKTPIKSLKTPDKLLYSQLSRSSSSRMPSPFPSSRLNLPSNSSNITPWVTRSAAQKSNQSSSQQSSKYSQILTGQTAKFSIPSQLNQIHLKAEEKLQKNYEKHLKNLWTQIKTENTEEPLISNPNLKEKQPRPSILPQKLRTDSKNPSKKLKSIDSQGNLPQNLSRKTEDNQKLFEGPDHQYQSTPDLQSIAQSSHESRSIPHSNSTQTIRYSLKPRQRPSNSRFSILNSLKRTKTTLIPLPDIEKSFEILPHSKFIHNCGNYLVTLIKSTADTPNTLWTSIKSFLLNPKKTPPPSPDVKSTLKSLFKDKEVKPERFQFFWPSPQKSRNFEKRLSAFIFKDTELDEDNKKRIKAKEEFLNNCKNRPKSSEKTEILVKDPDFEPFSDTQPSEDMEKLKKKKKFALKIENLIRKRAKSNKKSRHERCKTLVIN